MLAAFMLVILSVNTGKIQTVIHGFQDRAGCEGAVTILRQGGKWEFYDKSNYYVCIPTKGEE